LYDRERHFRLVGVRLGVEVNVDREREMGVCGEKCPTGELPRSEDQALLAERVDIVLPVSLISSLDVSKLTGGGLPSPNTKSLSSIWLTHIPHVSTSPGPSHPLPHQIEYGCVQMG
jgi:hypothetical protein